MGGVKIHNFLGADCDRNFQARCLQLLKNPRKMGIFIGKLQGIGTKK